MSGRQNPVAASLARQLAAQQNASARAAHGSRAVRSSVHAQFTAALRDEAASHAAADIWRGWRNDSVLESQLRGPGQDHTQDHTTHKMHSHTVHLAPCTRCTGSTLR